MAHTVDLSKEGLVWEEVMAVVDGVVSINPLNEHTTI